MSPDRVIESLMEVWRITEMRDGAIYGTRYVEDKWVQLDEVPPAGFLFVPLSTEKERLRMEMNLPSMRARKIS